MGDSMPVAKGMILLKALQKNETEDATLISLLLHALVASSIMSQDKTAERGTAICKC